MAQGWSNTSTQQGQLAQNPTIPGFSIGGGGGGGTSESGSFSGIDSPEALKFLMDYLTQQMGGGTSQEQAMRAERMKQIGQTRSVSGDYSKGAAFSDASALMAQNLQKALEKNMPVINKAIQGAGTSAGSMQALLSQKLATESSQAASALGAEQAKSYGGIQAQLQSVLEALTRADPNNSNNILSALSTLKNTRQYSTSNTAPTNPTFSMTASGGGQSLVNPQAPAPSGIQSGVWYGPGMVPRDQAWVDRTSNLPRASGGGDSGAFSYQQGSQGQAGNQLTSDELLSLANDSYDSYGGW